MKNFRVGENRGITLVVLVITIVVMLIITTTVISLSTNNLKTKHLSNMYTDIKSLDDKVAVFYNQYGTLPLKEKFTGSMQFQTAANPNDDLDGYYVIDVNKLNNLILTKKLTWQNDDVYIINKKTHTIYYPHGVTLDGETYYRLPGEYSVIKEPENIEGEIAIAINPSTPTNKDVTATITWASGNYSATKEVSTNGGTTYTEYKGDSTQIPISENCVIKARIRKESEEIKTFSLEVSNIDKTNPTVTPKQSSVTITEGDSNTLGNYFTIVANGKYGISSIVYTDTSNNNMTITNTNTLTEGSHIIKCTATKETGATANATITIVVEEKNTGITATEVARDASYIGKYVNYTVPNGGDPNVKWRIFYADSSNIYLIASDYLKYDYVPTKTKNGTEYTMYKKSDYCLSFDDMYQAYTGSADITDARITKWMKWVGQYPNSTNANIRSVAYMLDSNIWNTKYQNSYAEYVLGGPTIEMFCASYKVTHPTRYIECESYTTNGYKVKWSDGSYSIDISGLSTSELENLYVISDPTNALAYWLASPSAYGGDHLLGVNYVGYVYYAYYGSSHVGLRPLVCLESNVQLVPNGNAYDLSM